MKRKTGAFIAAVLLAAANSAISSDDDVVLWPEHHRSFLQHAPGLLLDEDYRQAFLAADESERDRLVEEFMNTDPIPETPENELVVGIKRRLGLVLKEHLSVLDHRARLIFLNGLPTSRERVDCGTTFVPLEIWSWQTEMAGGGPALVVYEPSPGGAWRLWYPTDSKRVLYKAEMEYLWEQVEELGMHNRARKWVFEVCPDARAVDDATGIDGLRRFRDNRPTVAQLQRFMSPPADLAIWARQAALTPLPGGFRELEIGELEIFFPEELQQRLLTRFVIPIPAASSLQITDEEGEPGFSIAVEGVLEQDDRVFDRFRNRFKLTPPDEDVPIMLVVDHALRPERRFVVHLLIEDEVSGATAFISRGFEVPEEAQPVEVPPLPEGSVIAMGEELARQQIAGRDSLVLLPPPGEVVLGLWRAEVLVTGENISKVKFLVDEVVQMTRNSRPFTAELRLAQFPVEQVIRAEGYNTAGELIGSDEVILNQPRGALRVRILEPERGAVVAGPVEARVEVVVPEDRRVEQVEFKVNEESIAVLTKPPYEVQIDVPVGGGMAYLAVTASLDDGSRAEEVRFLNAPEYLEQVEVKLVELYTTVTDKSGRLARGLTVDQFEVKEDGRPQSITKFELVEDMPLTLGIVVDTSGSMSDSLAEAKAAALGFLHNIITLRDKVFAVGFSDRPVLLMPATDDVDAVEDSLRVQESVGWTTLHDAVVTSLYYFRGVRGRRAMVLLSDGDDTASAMSFRDALEYARRSGVTIYSIGLGVGVLKSGIRNKLSELAEETGGQSFFISRAEELSSVYQEIENELRSQYLLAYSSDRPEPDGQFRMVEVKVNGGGLKARTIRGYYP